MNSCTGLCIEMNVFGNHTHLVNESCIKNSYADEHILYLLLPL